MTGEESAMTGTQPYITLKRPGDCSEEELSRFRAVVAAAGEVSEAGLQPLIGRAEALAFLESHGEIIGVGALKRPRSIYRAKVFQKANAPSKASDFDLELGWVVVDEAHRGRGHSRSIAEGLLERSRGRRIYATSVSTNEPMHKTLAQCGFAQEGAAWPSHERSLLLFVKK